VKELHDPNRWTSDRKARAMLGAIDAIGSGVMVVDGAGLIRAINIRACVILRRLPEQLEGRSVLEIFGNFESGPDDTRATMSGNRHCEVTLPSGDTITVGYSRSAVEGDPDGAVAMIFQDITPKRKKQGERDQRLQLSAVGEAMPTILHELRNPLSAVMSVIEVLKDERAGDADLSEHLAMIEGEVRRALLGLDGLGLGTRKLRSQFAEQIEPAIETVCTVLAPRAKRAGVTITMDVQAMPPLYIDPAAVRAVVYNLVSNALHACAQGQRVRVSASFDDDVKVLRLAVEDSGAGMSADVLARCTELFFTTKRVGSGIGLALCKELVTKGGGRFEIKSVEGQGTSVTILVPIADLAPG
jgi:two-component system sensor histidine kinase AtoS